VKKPGYVLDSYALLAYFQAEPGGLRVKDLLKQAKAGNIRTFLSLINLGEIIYIIRRKLGDDRSMHTLQDVRRLPIQLGEVTMERVLAAAHLKAHYSVSYADAFAIALAQELNATVVTGDPEFKKVESLVSLLWL
jgi:ribonuclease VapC